MFLPEYPELTPAMRGVLERMSRVRRPPLHTLSPAEARAAYAAGAEVLELPRPALGRVEDLLVPTRDGAVLDARLYAPDEATRPLLVYFHGGGFTVGGIGTHDVLCRGLSSASGCAVVSVAYRLAPEHRFPTAVDDAWDAVQWLSTPGHVPGVDGSLLALGGDSAGGTLATVCALMARDEHLPVRLQLLFYPGVGAPPSPRYGLCLVLELALIDYFFEQYITPGERGDWRFAPLNAEVAGAAPAWIGLAQGDPMAEGAEAYAAKLRAAGVPVDLRVYPGVTHEFIKMGRALPEARQALAAAAAALRKALFP